jgi:hypothetical protein
VQGRSELAIFAKSDPIAGGNSDNREARDRWGFVSFLSINRSVVVDYEGLKFWHRELLTTMPTTVLRFGLRHTGRKSPMPWQASVLWPRQPRRRFNAGLDGEALEAMRTVGS